ncbi:MAG: hypothetical protein KBC64_00640 [Simkaniaceae bacterium]|nr:hypothetical protein [Simkaniaceae bacterium]
MEVSAGAGAPRIIARLNDHGFPLDDAILAIIKDKVLAAGSGIHYIRHPRGYNVEILYEGTPDSLRLTRREWNLHISAELKEHKAARDEKKGRPTYPRFAFGGFKRLFNAYSVTVESDGVKSNPASLPPTHLVAKIKSSSRPCETLDLLADIPQSDYLIARPDKSFIPEAEGKSIYITMKKFQGGDLFSLIEKESSKLKRLQILLEGIPLGLRGLDHLHQHGLVHADPTIQNMYFNPIDQTGGLFDYDTLRRMGMYRSIKGPSLDQQPPESLCYLYLRDIKKSTVLEVLRSRQQHITQLQHNYQFTADDLETGLMYGPAIDIFIVAYQFVLAFENADPTTWPYLSEEEKVFFNKALNIRPEERPSAREFIDALGRIERRLFSPRVELEKDLSDTILDLTGSDYRSFIDATPEGTTQAFLDEIKEPILIANLKDHVVIITPACSLPPSESLHPSFLGEEAVWNKTDGTLISSRRDVQVELFNDGEPLPDGATPYPLPEQYGAKYCTLARE